MKNDELMMRSRLRFIAVSAGSNGNHSTISGLGRRNDNNG